VEEGLGGDAQGERRSGVALIGKRCCVGWGEMCSGCGGACDSRPARPCCPSPPYSSAGALESLAGILAMGFEVANSGVSGAGLVQPSGI